MLFLRSYGVALSRSEFLISIPGLITVILPCRGMWAITYAWKKSFPALTVSIRRPMHQQ